MTDHEVDAEAYEVEQEYLEGLAKEQRLADEALSSAEHAELPMSEQLERERAAEKKVELTLAAIISLSLGEFEIDELATLCVALATDSFPTPEHIYSEKAEKFSLTVNGIAHSMTTKILKIVAPEAFNERLAAENGS